MEPRQPASWKVQFFSPTYGVLSLDRVIHVMREFLGERPQDSYRLLVGTDSVRGRSEHTVLVTALVLHRVGNGGIYFVLRQNFRNLQTLQVRILQEAITSVDVAQRLLAEPSIADLLIGDIEIHVDVGHVGPTRDLIREIVGMVQAHGFPVKTKPDSYAASKVADRYTAVY